MTSVCLSSTENFCLNLPLRYGKSILFFPSLLYKEETSSRDLKAFSFIYLILISPKLQKEIHFGHFLSTALFPVKHIKTSLSDFRMHAQNYVIGPTVAGSPLSCCLPGVIAEPTTVCRPSLLRKWLHYHHVHIRTSKWAPEGK